VLLKNLLFRIIDEFFIKINETEHSFSGDKSKEIVTKAVDSNVTIGIPQVYARISRHSLRFLRLKLKLLF